MFCCKKKDDILEKTQLAFFTLCENTGIGKEEMEKGLKTIQDNLPKNLTGNQLVKKFLLSKNYSPIHKLAKLGNHVVLKWYII